MDELDAYCARMLGAGEAAAAAADSARESAGHLSEPVGRSDATHTSELGGADRLSQLAHAVHACRARARADGGRGHDTVAPAGGEGELSRAVAAELSRATARLSQRHQEALALRELIGLSHDELATVIGVDPSSPALLLARARLRLRSELRGSPMPAGECAEWERTLRTATLRQDHEPVVTADDDWLVDHLGHCAECGRAHAAMLEGSACYRGWRFPDAIAAAAMAPAGTP